MASIFRISLGVLLILIESHYANAQTTYGVTYHFADDTVETSSGKTFSNRLIVQNHGDSAVTLAVTDTAQLTGLIRIPASFALKPGETRSFPVKYIADRHTIKKSVQAIRIGLRAMASQTEVSPPATFYIRLTNVSGLLLETEQPVYYLNQGSNQTQLMLNCSNTGIIPIDFRLVLTEVPEGLEFTGEQLSMALQPGALRQLPFTARNKLSIRQPADFSVTIEAVDAGGKTIASTRIRIQSAGSINTFANAPFGNVTNNMAALRLLSINQHSSIYQMQANGDLDFSRNRSLHYQLQLDYYQQLQGFNAYDTHLSFHSDRMGIKLGNIYENLDYAISGRGGKATYHFNGENHVSLYALQNNYMLVSNVFQQIPGENILAANYAFLKNEKEGRITYLHGRNAFNALDNDQLSGRIPINMKTPNQQLILEAGYSRETFRDESSTKHAVAAGFDYSISANGLQFASNNYYSTPYYTGIRRGLWQSDTRLTKTTADGQIWSARVGLLNNRPQFQGRWYSQRFNAYQNGINTFEIGYSRTVGSVYLTINPYLMQQRLTNGSTALDDNNTEVAWASSAIRTQIGLNYASPNHGFYVHADYGYTYKHSAGASTAPFHSLRINGNYTNPFFGISAFLQLNPYYLSDVFSIAPGASYRLFSVGPNTRFSAWDNKLQVQVSALYSYYGFTNNRNYSLTGSARWQMKNHWAIAADAFYTVTHMRPAFFDTRQFRVGIEKQFSGLTAARGKKLALIYYEDRNNNGMRDAGEPPAPDMTVKIKDKTAFTDGEGRVEFRQMPPGNYTVELLTNGGWAAGAPMHIVVEKNKTIEFPLIKSQVLQGNLIVVGKNYLTTKPVLSGIRIQVADDQGKQQHTLTDADGHYTFYLPPGTYQVSVATADMPFSIENEREHITITDSNTPFELNFKYRDERRRVGVTRF
ncbi:SdrD B-like domain-containing protein [Parapedobacter sp. DT-150]|uniref:SdrD B-like domain-containing protein n=1 Tax=Parapedobacter sp. DT-150 TaxID=3396162 RepID=UPI003F5400D2